jgi:hypothetical protein
MPSEALASGVTYLISRQSDDGAWHSDGVGLLKDGTALTPFAITALQEAHDAGVRTPAVEASIRKGLVWLSQFTKKDGSVAPPADGFEYPMYTATLAIKAYSHPTAHAFLLARDGWVKFVKERQLTEKLGWKPEDKQYGGWGYCRVIPKRLDPNVIGPANVESNLSATVFALDALRTAGELDADTAKGAAVFVRRCQNKDGGFHFIYDDPTRNKAGLATTEPPTFHSYGSTTADGIRALTLCQLPEDKQRRDNALRWLAKHFQADTHPGTYNQVHEPNREAVYFYYAASVAKAFRDHLARLDNANDWADQLGRELVRRQKPDGSWVNLVELVRENDPIIATCNALSTLATCTKP